MPELLKQTARREAEWVQRYSRLYRDRMAHLIEKVNRTLTDGSAPSTAEPTLTAPVTADAAGQSIRCCLEAVDLMLSSQAEFAQVIDRWATQSARTPAPPLRRAA